MTKQLEPGPALIDPFDPVSQTFDERGPDTFQNLTLNGDQTPQTMKSDVIAQGLLDADLDQIIKNKDQESESDALIGSRAIT